MNIFNNKKTYIQQKKSSTVGRLFIAFLMVMSFICIFDNRFVVNADSSYSPIDVHIFFDCKEVDGVDKNSYKISIKSEKEQAPVPKIDTVTVNNSGKGEFVVTVSEPGTYEYQIYEIKGSEERIKYDETKYDVIVGVFSSENGELSYSVAVTLAGTDDKPESVAFENGTAGSKKIPETDADKEKTTEAITTEVKTEETTETTTETTIEKITTEEKTEDVTVEDDTEAPPSKIEKTNNIWGKIKTGDETKVVLVMIILVVSLAGIVVVGLKKKHKEV